MGQPYVGEIRMFAGNFPPSGWLICNGQPLPISENDVLFQLIGTVYGGDGEETFNIPDFQGRVVLHQGTGSSGTPYQRGETGGVEEVTLTIQQIPGHTHSFLASTDPGSAGNPASSVLATEANVPLYKPTLVPTVAMAANMVSPVGGSQPHDNIQPLSCINYIISLFGVFPSQT